jgi:hypothetical protein
MPTTLANGGTVLTLPADILWSDEFAWSAVQELRQFSVAGALLIDRRLKMAGRPITLQGRADAAWATRAAALTLYSWVQQASPTLTLSLRGTSYSVAFDYSGAPLEVTPVVEYADPETTDFCFITLRLIHLG